MMEDESQALVDPSQAIPDPQQLQGQLDQQFQQRMAQTTNPFVRSQLGQAQMLMRLQGGDPRVQSAQMQRQKMNDIMSDVARNTPDDEDPLDYQTRLSHAILIGMSGVNPQATMAAAQNLTRLEQARLQRQALQADVTTSQARAQQATYEGQMSRMQPLYFVDQNKAPDVPIATITGVDEDGNPRPMTDVAKDIMAAQKSNPNAVMVTSKQLTDAKAQTAQLRLQGAMQMAAAKVQAAQISAAARGQAMDGRQAMMSNRILSATELGSTALRNIAEVPFGYNTGTLGMGSSPGASIFDSVRDNLRNKLTSEDTQRYTALSAGLERNLSMIEMQGGLQGGQKFSEQIHNALALRDGDTPATIMSKLAEARQIIEVGSKVYLKDPKLDPGIKAEVENNINQLQSAIPFTQHDVTTFLAAQDKSPRLTYAQWAQQQRIGQQTGAGGAPTTATAGGDIEAERQAAKQAISSGAPEAGVKARFKQRTGQDL